MKDISFLPVQNSYVSVSVDITLSEDSTATERVGARSGTTRIMRCKAPTMNTYALGKGRDSVSVL